MTANAKFLQLKKEILFLAIFFSKFTDAHTLLLIHQMEVVILVID